MQFREFKNIQRYEETKKLSIPGMDGDIGDYEESP